MRNKERAPFHADGYFENIGYTIPSLIRFSGYADSITINSENHWARKTKTKQTYSEAKLLIFLLYFTSALLAFLRAQAAAGSSVTYIPLWNEGSIQIQGYG